MEKKIKKTTCETGCYVIELVYSYCSITEPII